MFNIFDVGLRPFAPHICKGCGRPGSTLCENCIFDNIDNKYAKCVVCGALTGHDNLCQKCRVLMPFDRAFVVGERKEVLEKLVGDFKYESERDGANAIAKLLDGVLPALPKSTVIIPIPTIAPHIRARGFGHTEIVTKRLARIQSLKCDLNLLLRTDSSVQHGLKLAERKKQAKKAFEINTKRPVPSEVLLFDDIYTTGATIIAASQILKKAGVKTINIAIVARQSK